MSDNTYYFTGTRSQLLEKLESFNKEASFVDGELTFKITVEDLHSDAEVPEDAQKLEQEQLPFEDEPVKPATTEPVEGTKK